MRWLKDWLNRRRFLSLHSKVERFSGSLRALRQNHKSLYIAFCFSVIAQILGTLTTYTLALGLTLKVPLFKFFLVIPVIGLASMSPSLGGLGVRELGYLVFFRGLMSEEQAVTLSLLSLSLLYFFSFWGGIIYLFKGNVVKKSVP